MASEARVVKTPSGIIEWASAYLGWFVSNVIVGGVAILSTLFCWKISATQVPFPYDITLSLTTLAIAIAVTNVDFPSEYRDTHPLWQTWLRRLTGVVIFIGLGTTFMATINPWHGGTVIENMTALRLGVVLLVLAIIIGTAAFIVRAYASDAYLLEAIKEARAESEDFATTVDADGRTLARQAHDANDYGGIRL